MRWADGNRYEKAAAVFLKKAGLRIVNRNYRTRIGELDIIAYDGNTLVFIEVKGRKVGGDPLDSFSEEKIYRVRRMAEVYLAAAKLWETEVRFDAVLVREDVHGKLEVEHLREAF